MKVILLGATKGIGRSIARALAERGDTLYLLGHEPEELEKSSKDLEQRAGGRIQVGHGPCNLEDTSGFASALDEADKVLGGFDTVIVTAALFASQEKLEADVAFTQRMLAANFTNTIIFCEHVRKRLLSRGGGTLCVFSSVAGERGRKPIILYGASKAGLSAYLEGLDHKYRAEGLRTITIKPGFVKTSMTEGLKPPPFASEPEAVAKDVVRALASGTPVVYTPRIWALIMLVIRFLPRFVMRKIGF